MERGLFNGKKEIEILKFTINNKYYAVDISNVKEIIPFEDVIEYPNTKLEILGMTLIRNEVVTLIDLSYILNKIKTDNIENKMNLKYQYEDMSLAFVVDKILGIERITKENVEEVEKIVDSNLIVANAKINNKIYMIVDFVNIIEKVVM